MQEWKLSRFLFLKRVKRERNRNDFEENDKESEEKEEKEAKEDSTEENPADASPDHNNKNNKNNENENENDASASTTTTTADSSSLFPSFHCAICDRSFASAKQLAIHNRSTQYLRARFLTPRHKRRALKADASRTEKKEKTVKKESKSPLFHRFHSQIAEKAGAAKRRNRLDFWNCRSQASLRIDRVDRVPSPRLPRAEAHADSVRQTHGYPGKSHRGGVPRERRARRGTHRKRKNTRVLRSGD